MPQAILIPVIGDVKMIEVTPDWTQWYKFINYGEHTVGYFGFLFGDDNTDRYCHVYSDSCNDTGDTPVKLAVNERISVADDICYGDAIIFIQNSKDDVLEIPPISSDIVEDFLINYHQLDYVNPEHMKTVSQFIEAAGFDPYEVKMYCRPNTIGLSMNTDNLIFGQ